MTTISHLASGEAARLSLLARVVGLASKPVTDYLARNSTASILHALDDRTLDDIGILRGEIDAVVHKRG
ncbi:MAG: DUF1127 domain-containing protein [Hyphomicrobium sp.]